MAGTEPAPSIVPDLIAAERLRDIAMRAREVLTDPPSVLKRCARANWQGHAGADAVEALERTQSTLRKLLGDAAAKWQTTRKMDADTLGSLGRAAADCEDAVANAARSAVQGAASVPWSEVVKAVRLPRADGTGGDAVSAAEALRGKTVGLYFTASW
jgi:hypothetical protein